jgi:hypothetical protein
MRSRGRLAFRSTLAYALYLVFKRLKHKSLLRWKASHSLVFFISHDLPLTESGLAIIKKSIERSTLQKVSEFFRRQQFGIYWPDNSHLSIIIKYAKVVILLHLFGDFFTRFIVTVQSIWDRKYRAWTCSVVEILGLDSILGWHIGQPSRSQMRSRGHLTFRSTFIKLF